MKSRGLRYGLIGCGGFGRFCLREYLSIPGFECVAVADRNNELALQTAREFGVDAYDSPEELLERDDVELVHLATPPSTHAPLAMLALQAGKHVLSEKPLALSIEDANGMIELAHQRERVLAVNLIMRYNPLCKAIKTLIERGILGIPLYASLENAAQDETLGPKHWFWDRAQSGGIFIEHGVHFFDLFEWWFGEGRLSGAHQLARPGTSIIDQVHCAVQYGDSTLGTFYHGFHQMLRRDRQQWRIVFETGTVTLEEWVPTRMELDAHVDGVALERLRDVFPDAGISVLKRYEGTDRGASSRHVERVIDLHASIIARTSRDKMDLYGQMVRDLLSDQIAAIHDPAHRRLVSERNGLASLAYAVAATEAAAVD